MSATAWILILVFKYPGWQTGGVVSVNMPDYRACAAALKDAQEMRTFADGRCIQIWGNKP